MCFEGKGVLNLIITGNCTQREKEKGNLRIRGRKISNFKAFDIFKSVERWNLIPVVSECVCMWAGSRQSLEVSLLLSCTPQNITKEYAKHTSLFITDAVTMLDTFHLDTEHGTCCML